MEGLVSSLAAIFVIAPALFFGLLYVISSFVFKDRKKAKDITINLTTVVLIISVHFMMMVIWTKSMLWFIIILLISVAIIFIFLYWKVKGEIVGMRAFRGYWRLIFLVFSCLYISLFIYGIVKRVIQNILV